MTETLVRTNEEKSTSARREDLQSVTPHLVCAGAAEAMEFYKRAFGAVELMRLPGREGRLMHGSIAVGGGRVMLG
jgi:PhnB protein